MTRTILALAGLCLAFGFCAWLAISLPEPITRAVAGLFGGHP